MCLKTAVLAPSEEPAAASEVALCTGGMSVAFRSEERLNRTR